MSENVIELPRYKSHKEVWALKIKEAKVVDSDGGGVISFEDARYADIAVEPEYMNKHEPKAGGYYVVYKGGYKSFSPADAFEEGYSLV